MQIMAEEWYPWRKTAIYQRPLVSGSDRGAEEQDPKRWPGKTALLWAQASLVYADRRQRCSFFAEERKLAIGSPISDAWGDIPRGVKIIVRNGYNAWIDHNKENGRLEGIERFFQFLNIKDGETLVFEHMGGFEFRVKVYNLFGCENNYLRMPTPYLAESDGEAGEGNMTAFHFEVKSCRMLDYEYGVDIPAEYRNVCQPWLMVDHISAYVGFRCWPLQTRHRRDMKRTKINGGWLVSQRDNAIEEGDICFFEWMNNCARNF
ncbi:hypothetical protein AgCh_034399 [Apium graveolens]